MPLDVKRELAKHFSTRKPLRINDTGLTITERNLIRDVSVVLDLIPDEKGIPLRLSKNDSGQLTVRREGHYIEIDYPSLPGLARGLSHTRQVWQTGIEVAESRHAEDAGAMVDCSRNSVPNIATMQQILSAMAAMGLNVLFLYMEDTYLLPNYPYFGYQRGAYTHEELREIDNYAEGLGIEVIPCIQTLGHLKTYLRWQPTRPYRDTNNILLVGEEKTYELIEEMFRVLSGIFRTKRIHIGMDEAYELGRGRSLDLHGYKESWTLMREHLDRVTALAKAKDLEPMMWSDMYFFMASPTDNYYDLDAPLTDEIKQAVNQEVGLVYWDYYNSDSNTYDRMLTRHEELGAPEIWFAGGVWTWNGMVVNHGKTFQTSEAAFAACRKHGIQHLFATAWGDNGAETNVLEAFIGLQYFGEYTWQEHVPDRFEVLRRAHITTGADAYAFYAMRLFDEVPGVPEDNPQHFNPSKYILWNDPLIGLLDPHILPQADALADHYLTLSDYFDDCAQTTRTQSRVFFLQAAQLADCLQRKVRLTQELRPAYLDDDYETLSRLVKTDIPELIAALTDLQAFTLSLWYLHAKPEGSEVIDARFGTQLARLRTCQDRVDGYLSGVYDSLPELENERLPFDGRTASEVMLNPHIRVNVWQDIFSANPI